MFFFGIFNSLVPYLATVFISIVCFVFSAQGNRVAIPESNQRAENTHISSCLSVPVNQVQSTDSSFSFSKSVSAAIPSKPFVVPPVYALNTGYGSTLGEKVLSEPICWELYNNPPPFCC